MPRGKIASTNQKHFPDVRTDVSLVWNFSARFSDIIGGGGPVVESRSVGYFQASYPPHDKWRDLFLGRSQFKSLVTNLVNSQLIASWQLGFLIPF